MIDHTSCNFLCLIYSYATYYIKYYYTILTNFYGRDNDPWTIMDVFINNLLYKSYTILKSWNIQIIFCYIVDKMTIKFTWIYNVIKIRNGKKKHINKIYTQMNMVFFLRNPTWEKCQLEVRPFLESFWFSCIM